MVPTSDPKTWVPYMNTRDCSQGFCSLYCPQWCYIIFPPPPPLDFPEENSSGPTFSPLVIAIIGILASAFLLVSYYAIMSKYCGNRNASTTSRSGQNRQTGSDSERNRDQDRSIHEPWNAANTGLDEALIKSIKVLKYKIGGGDDDIMIDGSDCAVCLSEFQEDENLRVLPKCSHAFHVSCIDTWLKSHSNCPLCRSNIIFLNCPPFLEDPPSRIESSAPEIHEQESAEVEEAGNTESNDNYNNVPKSPVREHTITIREEEENQETIRARRSVSMDFPCHGQLSIADILRIDC